MFAAPHIMKRLKNPLAALVASCLAATCLFTPIPNADTAGVVGAESLCALTPDAALRALTDIQVDPLVRIEPTTAVLRQVYDSYSPGELGSLEDRLVDLIINGDKAHEKAARLALVVAADTEYDDPGVPYAGSRAAFIRVFETLRTDDYERARSYLVNIARLDGLEYIREVFAASEQPSPCFQPHDARPGEPLSPASEWCPPVRKVLWCDAGQHLVGREGGPDRRLHVRLCSRIR